ncbi:MAG: hypothetical protein RL235_698 [Chlamydiota bacterium]|jgi:hypothetical protein
MVRDIGGVHGRGGSGDLRPEMSIAQRMKALEQDSNWRGHITRKEAKEILHDEGLTYVLRSPDPNDRILKDMLQRLRPEDLRPEDLRPDNLRPEDLRPDHLRSDDLRPDNQAPFKPVLLDFLKGGDFREVLLLVTSRGLLVYNDEPNLQALMQRHPPAGDLGKVLKSLHLM